MNIVLKVIGVLLLIGCAWSVLGLFYSQKSSDILTNPIVTAQLLGMLFVGVLGFGLCIVRIRKGEKPQDKQENR